MRDPLMITIRSALHGARVWRRVGEQHMTRDGREIVVGLG
jgi:hypothetical protein